MNSDRSFSNYGYQLDEIENYGDKNSYTIPKARIDRASLGHKSQQDQLVSTRVPGHLEQPDSLHPKLPAVKSTNSIEESQQFDAKNQKEDYSLLSYFSCFECYKKNKSENDSTWKKRTYKILKKILLCCAVLFYVAFFLSVLSVSSAIQLDPDSNYWCDADGFLIIITTIAVVGIFYFHIFKPYAGLPVYRAGKSICNPLSGIYKHRAFSPVLVLILIICLLVFLVIDTADDRSRLLSALGIVIFLIVGFLFSAAPRKIVWRHVVWGIGLQFVFGLLILRLPIGRAIFTCLGDKVDRFLKFTDDGSSFVFGTFIIQEISVFAFKVLSVVLFFSFCIQILYFYGIMQWIVMKLGWLLQISVGTTACESVNAAANIFLGQTEAPLLIKPYLPDMTKSEIHAVMTGGFATIAGSVLAAYISFGVSPSHLLSASVMSAPAALAFAKLFYPETEKSRTTSDNIKVVKGTEANVLHAACEGVTNAIPLVANIAANLLTFVAFISLIDTVLNWCCLLLNVEDGVCRLSTIFGYVFMPLAWIMGVPWVDCYYVGQLIGTKTFVNEFVGYLELQKLTKAGTITKRSQIISTYALCGFSNISSIGIQIGGLGAMAPERKRDIATVAVRAMIAGSIACFLTACVAGTLLTADELNGDSSYNSTETL